MPLQFWLATIVGASLVAARIFSQVALWQRKEYRWDRLASVLRTNENRTLITWPLLCAMLAVDVGWVAALQDNLWVADIAGWLSLGIQLGHVGFVVSRRGVTRPDPTPKALIIIIVGTLISLGAMRYSFVLTELIALQWATVVLIVPMIVSIAVGLINVLVAIRKRDIISQAKVRRQKLHQLTVIGITGSYGKTSTKFFLEQLLRARRHVAVTSEHRNALLPVAQDMLQQLSSSTSIYVVEMGAYRRGEIAELCALTLPRLGLVTAIGNQHAALFGSRENIVTAKWELIDALPAGGTAILNYDDPQLRKKAGGIPQKIIWFSTHGHSDTKMLSGVFVRAVTYEDRHTHCRLQVAHQEFEMEIPLASEALLSSAVAAAAAALGLGLTPHEIIEGLRTLHPFPHTMEIRTNSRGTAVIDDSYSANEQGALIAIRHLARFQVSKKVIVLTPLIELGRDAARVHERIGAALAASYATVIVNGTSYVKELLQGGKHVRPDFSLQTTQHPRKLQEQLQRHLGSDTVLLLEGRLPDVVRKSVLL